MIINTLLYLILSSISSAEQSRSVSHKISDNRLRKGIAVYTDRSAWLNALTDYDITTEDFSSVLPQSASAYTLGAGATDVGAFDIVISSAVEPNTLSVGNDGVATFDASYKKGEVEISINNFDSGIAYGFGGNWEVVDEAGINTDDFKILVDGIAVDIGSYPSGRNQYGIGFVGIIDFTNGFSEITYATTGSGHTHVSLGQISVSSKTTSSPTISSSPSLSPPPSTSPSLSYAPSKSARPSAAPSSSQTFSPTAISSVSPSTTSSTTPSVSSNTTAPSNAVTLSAGEYFAQFWLSFLTGDQFSGYTSTICGCR